MSRQVLAPPAEGHPVTNGEIPAPMFAWFTEQFQIAIREMFKRGETANAFDFNGRDPQTGAMELYAVVISIMPKRQMEAIQQQLAEQLQKAKDSAGRRPR